MALQDLVPKENLLRSAEKMAETVSEDILLPAAHKLVADTASPWDDSALAVFEPFLKAIIDSIDPTDNAPAPEAAE